VSEVECDELYLVNSQIGAASSAGVIEVTGTLVSLRGTTINAGSTIEFIGAEGTLLVDGPSYKQLLDNDISVTNGHVVRDDGSWPADAENYTSASPTINFAKNPRAIMENNGAFTCTFLAPLTREVQILMVNGGGGGGAVDWGANVKWSDGLPPELPTGAGEETLLRFDYEESIDTYYGWVPLMNAEP
jgi:hypothetical protein